MSEFQGKDEKWYWLVAENEHYRMIRSDDSGEYTIEIIENGEVLVSRYANSVESWLGEILWEKYQEGLDW